MKSKMIIAILSDGSLFRHDESFELLKPKYKVNSGDIESHLREKIKEKFGRN
jgi:hypothetical protein